MTGETSSAVDHGHPVALEQPSDAAGQSLDHLLAAGDDRIEVDGRLADAHAELAGLARLGDHVGGPEHEFGRDAGVVEAAAAEAVALDHRGAHAELRGADGGDVAAGTGADDDAVELSHDAFSVTSATCFDHWRLYQSMFCSLDPIT